MGYDFEATLTSAADTILSDGISNDDRALIAISVLHMPIQVRDDLYANGFISKALKVKLDKIARRLRNSIYRRPLQYKPPPPKTKTNTTMRMINPVVLMIISSLFAMLNTYELRFPLDGY